MADYIEREAVRNELYDADAITMRGVVILNNFPAADVVEVVRCKNCKFCKTFYPEKQIDKEPIQVWFCELYRCKRKPDEFCSDGERKPAND